MSALSTLEVERVRRACDRLRVAEERAVNRSVLAVRALERALMRAAAPGGLRGMSILAWPAFRAAALVGPRARAGVDTRVPSGGAEVLVLLPTGELAWARVRVEDGVPATRGLLDREIRDTDLEDFSRALQVVAARHAQRCDRSVEGWERVGDLADRVRAAVA